MTASVGSTMELPCDKITEAKGTANSKEEPPEGKSYLHGFVKLTLSVGEDGAGWRVSCEEYHATSAFFLADEREMDACPSCCISLHFTDIGIFSTMARCLL